MKILLKMNVPKKILAKWELLRATGDPAEIAELAGVHPETVRKVFRTGEASLDVFHSIGKFYAKREKEINAYIQ